MDFAATVVSSSMESTSLISGGNPGDRLPRTHELTRPLRVTCANRRRGSFDTRAMLDGLIPPHIESTASEMGTDARFKRAYPVHVVGLCSRLVSHRNIPYRPDRCILCRVGRQVDVIEPSHKPVTQMRGYTSVVDSYRCARRSVHSHKETHGCPWRQFKIPMLGQEKRLPFLHNTAGPIVMGNRK